MIDEEILSKMEKIRDELGISVADQCRLAMKGYRLVRSDPLLISAETENAAEE